MPQKTWAQLLRPVYTHCRADGRHIVHADRVLWSFATAKEAQQAFSSWVAECDLRAARPDHDTLSGAPMNAYERHCNTLGN